MTSDFVEKAKEADPVAVVTEATNMTGASILPKQKLRIS